MFFLEAKITKDQYLIKLMLIILFVYQLNHFIDDYRRSPLLDSPYAKIVIDNIMQNNIYISNMSPYIVWYYFRSPTYLAKSNPPILDDYSFLKKKPSDVLIYICDASNLEFLRAGYSLKMDKSSLIILKEYAGSNCDKTAKDLSKFGFTTLFTSPLNSVLTFPN